MSSRDQEIAVERRLAARAHDGTIDDWLRCPSPIYARVVPPEVLTADCRDFALALGHLPSAEADCVAKAVLKRRGEFAGGRAAARAALAALGLDDLTLTIGDDRIPTWPRGIIGTITHKDAFAAAAVARRTSHLGLGIDSEEIGRVQPALWPMIAVAEERRMLTALPHDEQAVLASVLFAAKEAYFKAQFPETKRSLGFQDGIVSIDGDRLLVEIRTASGERNPFDRAEGRFLSEDGFVHVAVWIDRAETL
jgi:4'-phosphopantetheinyl transferase EntD